MKARKGGEIKKNRGIIGWRESVGRVRMSNNRIGNGQQDRLAGRLCCIWDRYKSIYHEGHEEISLRVTDI